MCFFFSSRRRHTRCSRDWSSDVCSSDLLFYGQDGEACVRCAITREALDDHFHGDGKDKLEVFRANRQPVEKRSEEHTSELQSRLHLVCRLLLEKKKLLCVHTCA